MAKSGQASVEVLADFSKFAATFQRDLNAALRGVKIDMTGIADQISNGVRDGVNAANKEFQRLGDQAGSALDKVAKKASETGRSMAASFASAGREMSSVGDQMTMALTLPIAAAGAVTITTAGDFEKAMNKVKAATESTGQEFTDLRNLAIDLGSTTAFSASEAAFAMNELATAGFDTTEIMTALPGVLDMAAAGSVGLGEAAEIAGNILNGYGIQTSKIGWVNDILARTFLSTATSLTDLGETFKYVGPVAASAGVSFTEISAAIGLMGNAGIKGSEAGTALRGAISRLLKPTNDVETTLRALGVTVVSSSGKLLPLIDIVRQLEKSGADTADMMTIFGLEAGPAMQALVSQGSTALGELTVELKNAGGTAAKVATTQMAGFNGSMDELSSAAEGLMIAIGDAGLLGWMTSLAKELTALTAATSKLSPFLLRIATITAVVVAAIGPFLAVFGRMATAIGEGILAFKKFGAWALKVAPWLSALGGPVGWVIAAIVALGIAAVVAYKKCEAFRTVVDRAFRAVATAALWMWQNAIMPAFTWVVAQAQRVGSAIMVLWGQAQPVFIALGAAVMQMWNSAIRPAFTAIGGMFQQAGAAIMAFWTGMAQPALSAMMVWFGNLALAVRAWWVGNGDAVMRQAAAVVTWLGGVLTTIFTGIMAVLKGVAAVITWVVVNVLVPLMEAVIAVVKAVINVVIAMKPLWIVIGAIIVAAIIVIVAIVKVLWVVITTAFTAIAAIIQWLWTSVVVPVFSGIGSAIQVAAGVIQWLWTSIISPVFTAIGVVLGTVGTVIIWLWTSVFVPAFQGIGAVASWLWTSVIMPVFNAITGAIGVVVAAVTWLWTTFGPLFLAIGNLVWTVWSGIISIVFSLFKLAFTVVIAIAQVFWAIIQMVFMAVAGVIMVVWSTVISPVLAKIGALFTWLWGVISPVLSSIGEFFMRMWSAYISPVINWVSAALSWLWGVIVMIFNAIVAVVQSKIATIVATANKVTEFTNSVSSNFQAVVNSIRDKINTAISIVRGLPGQLIGALGNLASLLYNAGQNIINGLINGISNRIGALKAKISEAASSIRNALPFSPAKEGPLSGNGDPTIAGGKIVSMVAEGMSAQVPRLRAAAWGLADMALTAPAGGLAGGLAPIAGNLSGGASIVFQPGAINVTFSGVVPTTGQATATGAAVGQGIATELNRSKTATLVRSI
jgi:TP901 family phage tail tape measure protein